jgi:hypothetical protein
MSLVVASCSYAAARHAVERWHYSRRMPTAPLVRYGVWEHDVFVGAVVFGRGANNNLFDMFGIEMTEGSELVRVALRRHEAPVSQIVGHDARGTGRRTVRRSLLIAAAPGLRLLVSFYFGTTEPCRLFRHPTTGALLHERVVSPSGWKLQYRRWTRVPRSGDLERVMMPGKHRYVLPLDRAMRRRFAPLALPYPSADEGSKVSHPGPAGEGPVRARPSALSSGGP